MVINPEAVYALNAAILLDNYGRVDVLLTNAQEIYDWLMGDCNDET